VSEQGYTVPTPIQAQTIPHVLAGKDVVGCAQTGTGKTAAFALPVLHRLMNEPADKTARGPRKARVLVLSPTRELAAQIADSFGVYGRDTGLAHCVIYGGVSQRNQERALARGVDIIVATPGRLIDLMQQRLVDLSQVKTLILDEADRMLDMGFIQPIRQIAAATPKGRQTLLFSATMPKEVAHLASALLRDPVRIASNTVSSVVPKIVQSLYMVSGASKQSLLQVLLGDEAIESALVFTKTKHGAERVGRKLERAGVQAETIHGNKNQNQRKRALDAFRSGRARVLVATDVAARGLDVDGITHVINFDLPMEPEAYVHRIGRTGRAGATGIAISFCGGEERGLLRDIERLLGKAINVHKTPELPKLVESKDDHAPRPAVRPHTHFAAGEQGGGYASRGPRRFGGAKAGGHRGWRKPNGQSRAAR